VFSLDGDRAIYRMADYVYQDVGVNFTCIIVTDKEDFKSMREKTMGRLIVRSDRPPANSLLSISWTDDDYQTYSTVRQVNINQKKPVITQLGAFNERAFKLTFTDNQPLRIKALDVDINIGSA
jgi:hypothetical protein